MSDEISVKDSLLNLNTTLLSKPSLTLNPITSPEKTKIISTFCSSPSKINTPNECGWTPLYRTVIAGDLKATELLIQVGADPNIQSSLGETPLYQSVEMKQIEHVKLLLKYHSDPNISQNDGMTPLHLAVNKQEVLIVKLLLKYKAKANAKTKLFEQTPVHFAIKGNVDPTILLLLIQYNGSLVMKDKNGKRPIDYVNSDEMRNALKKLKLQKEEIFKSPNKNLYSTPNKNNWTINQVYTNTITSEHTKRNIELSSKAILQDPGNIKLGIIEVRSGNKDDNKIGKKDDNKFVNEESGFKKKLTFNDLDNSVIKENEQEYEIDSHKENNVSNYNYNTNKSNLENNSVNYNHNTNKSNNSNNYKHSTNKSNLNDIENDNKKDKNEKKNINESSNSNKNEENKIGKEKNDENEFTNINNKVNDNKNENNKKKKNEKNGNENNNKIDDKNENNKIKENDNKKESNNNNKEKQINEKISISSGKKNKRNNMNININVRIIDTTNDKSNKKRKKSKQFIISKKVNETSDDENIKNIDINGTIIKKLNKNNNILGNDTQSNMSEDSINTVNELESNKENNNLYSNQLTNDEMNTNTIIKNKYNNYKNQVLTTNRSKLSKYDNACTQTDRNHNNSFVSKKSYFSYQDIPFQSKISKENSKFSTRPSDELNNNNYNKSDNIHNHYYIRNKHYHHHNKINSYNTSNTIPSRLNNEKEEVEYIIYSNINGAEPKNLLKYICSNYQNIDISEVDINPIYQFLKSIDLLCYYKLLVSKGIFTFEKVISDMKKGKFKISINDIEELGISNPGHIYRIITKLEIDSEIIPIKISNVLLKIREILGEDFLNSSVHFNYGFGCCSSQKTKLISSVNFNLELWLKRNKLIHLYENFIRNGFDKLDYITLQMFSSFPINDNILRNDLHIYNEKERDILIFQLNRDVKSILKKIDKNNVFVTTNSSNSDSNNYDICNIF